MTRPVSHTAAVARVPHRPDVLRAAWTRVGALFSVVPASAPVDLEDLICATAEEARSDQRLFVVPASWLAVHHHLVDARRLGRRIDRLAPEVSATMGALLSLASAAAGAKNPLVSATAHCRALNTPEPLFPVMARTPGLLRLLKEDSLPLFTRWGFWHDDATLQLSAVRPVHWIVENCPELRYRLLVGPGLDAEVLAAADAAPTSIADIAKRLGSSYAATHAAVRKLAARGLLAESEAGWRPGPMAWQDARQTGVRADRQSRGRPSTTAR
jgi:hypothetical protein